MVASKLVRLAAVWLAACAHAAPAPSSQPALARSINRLADELLATTAAAGVSVAVVWRGETVVARGYGLADVAGRVPVDADTVFRIGSITKQFTAAAILQLAEQHRLSLDDDVTRYLPDYPTHGHAIRLRELLTHTSGIRDYEHGVPWFAAHMAEPRPGAELVAEFAAAPLDFEPGTQWSYSNSGYYLLGLVVEQVAHQPYADYVRDHVLGPAGITGIRYCPDTQAYPGAAHGYTLGPAGRAPAPPIAMVHAYAAGALCATASALVAWSAALAHGRIISAAAWRAMTTPARLASGQPTGYGLGVFLGELGGHPAIFHGGGINGFASTLAYYPADDLYIAVLVDTDGSFADNLGEAIARAALGVPRPAVDDLAIPAGEARAIAGRYAIRGTDLVLAIEPGDGAMFARRGDASERHKLLRQRDGGYLLQGSEIGLRFELGDGPAPRLHIRQAGVAFEADRVP